MFVAGLAYGLLIYLGVLLLTSWGTLVEARGPLRMPADGAERMHRPRRSPSSGVRRRLHRGHYNELVVAGGVWSPSALIGDVEIVAVPKLETVTGGLFGDETITVDRLDGG